jgi:hypothetical protein
MRNASWVVIALAIATGTAVAQPGNTPPEQQPQPYPPPQAYPPPQGAPGQPPAQPPGPYPQTGYQVGPVDVDSVIAKVGAEMPTIQTVAKGTLRRARRAISVGPTVGYWVGSVPAQDTYEQAITFGLGIEIFKVPILPEPEEIKALILERVKAKVKAQILDRLAGRQPEPLELEAMAKGIYQEVRAEVLGLENTRAKTMERPRFNIALEANRAFHDDAWMARLRGGIGIWKFTLGLSAAVAFPDRVKAYVGPELVLHFLISDKPRASVVDVFLRADLELRFRETNSDQMVLGARFLLDAI